MAAWAWLDLKGYGGIAQLEEHLLCKQGVSGSNPLTSTMIRRQGGGNQGLTGMLSL